MTESLWQIQTQLIVDNDALINKVLTVHQTLLEEYFTDALMINEALGIHLRSFRHLGDWRIFLLLTPWMLSRLLFPKADPGIKIPQDWQAEQCTTMDYKVLGPAVKLTILDHKQQAHLNFHSDLGHYLIQPLCLNMADYADPEAVFAAWNHVIETRDRNMEQAKKNCDWQKEISRRELFKRFRNSD